MDQVKPRKASPEAYSGGTHESLALDLTPDVTEEEELSIGVPLSRAGSRAPQPAPSTGRQGVDLSNRPKAWFMIGRGRTGKTLLLRWLIEQQASTADTKFVLADMDRTNATLSSYVSGVQRPPDGDEDVAAQWLEKLLAWAMRQKASVAIDLGGGDTTLRRLVSEIPDLAERLDAEGIAPVGAYLVGPPVDDLSPLSALEAGGFRPWATALVLNEGLIEPGLTREDAFARVMRHSAFNAAVTRGAVPIWMPRLIPAGAIEARRIQFGQARDGIVREGSRQTPLGPFDRSRVGHWLADMDAEFRAVRSWML